MPLCNPARPARALLLAGLSALMLALGGCTSDDGAGAPRTSAQPARRAGTTTDSGSRYLDAGGPLGGLTVETPPVAGR